MAWAKKANEIFENLVNKKHPIPPNTRKTLTSPLVPNSKTDSK